MVRARLTESPVDIDTHNANLEKIYEENVAFQDLITSFPSILDEENVPTAIMLVLEMIRIVADELNAHVRNNATEVKKNSCLVLNLSQRLVTYSVNNKSKCIYPFYFPK